jgi:hypothetical protein
MADSGLKILLQLQTENYRRPAVRDQHPAARQQLIRSGLATASAHEVLA